jgi:FkbM family methyltransferase
MFTLDLSGASRETLDQFYFYTKQGSRNELAAIKPHGFNSPIYLRRSTSDIDNFIQIFLNQEYDFLPEHPTTVLDLGGYTGLASAYLANKYPGARIILIEPDPDNYTMARLNLRQFDNIECLNIGVWSKTCNLTISAKVGGDWGTMVREVQEGELVSPNIKAMSITDIMKLTQIEWIDFLKIDIEGSEKEIFSDPQAKEWIQKSKIISCELHDRMVEGCSDAFHDAIRGEGFSHGRHGEYDFYIRNETIGR